ncbi:MAG TPA: hypothetical protein RMH99_11360 [Sandaracinaceae bacterium LLY-WYZ-13_1]|nr:hypothetical protein [Sandaracinaceae bacterium LLY-WYZ-13_1]
MGGPKADQLVLWEGDTLLAGSGVSYRTVRRTDGATTRVGIMTGSWTLPAARRRGCFSRIIDESCRLVRQRDGELLTAFVTADNASRRRLEQAGSAMMPTSYCVLQAPDAPTGGPFEAEEMDPGHASGLVRACLEAESSGWAHFAFETPAQWEGQILARPRRTTVLRLGDGGFAVLEERPTADSVLVLTGRTKHDVERALAELRARSASLGRALVYFTSRDDRATAAEDLGFERRPGFFTLLDADTRGRPEPLDERWSIQSGDRM